MKICVIGMGYVGLVSAACFADLGNNVWCVDKNNKKINLLNNNHIPFFEPGLEELVNKNYLSGRLRFTTNLNLAVTNSDVLFICVGTPKLKKSRSADLRHVFNVAKELSKYIDKFKIIVTKSTVPITTGDKIEELILKKNEKNYLRWFQTPNF